MSTTVACKLALVPVSLAQAKAFVGQEHRHNPPPVGHRVSVGVGCDEHGLHGVAIGGRPNGRGLGNMLSFEITRCCTDGSKNACSMLYGAMRRLAINLGYPPQRVYTYTRVDEPGTSLHAAGFVRDAVIKGRSWDTPSRRREDKSEVIDKIRWRAA